MLFFDSFFLQIRGKYHTFLGLSLLFVLSLLHTTHIWIQPNPYLLEAKTPSPKTVAENMYCDEQEISWAAMVGTQGLTHI
jgi:hypothetical protein